MAYQTFKTKHGFDLSIAASALQKEIRRGRALYAGYWANEIYTSGYYKYVWRRLLVISAEDCAGIITKEIKALYDSAMEVIKLAQGNHGAGRIFMGKAIVLLIAQPKNRDADHMNNFTHHESNLIDHEELLKTIDDLIAAKKKPQVPEYVHDCHTSQGKRKGKTKQQFFKEEFEALNDRTDGLFDDDIAKVKVGDKPSYPLDGKKDLSPAKSYDEENDLFSDVD